MNILIVGAGKVGSTLAAYLSREDHNVTIIDQNDTAIHRASDTLDVMCIKGPGAAPSVLREAGVEDADLVLATTNLDEVNMLCALTAKRLGAKFTIARIRDLAYTDDLPALQKDLNIDAVINPEYATALEISRLLRFPAAANVDTFFRGKVEMLGIRVQEGDPMVGIPLSDLFRRASSLSILFSAAERKGEVIIPNGDFVPRVGDKLYVTASSGDLARLIRSLHLNQKKIKNVMIIGGSRIAVYLAMALLDEGVDVKLIEIQKERCRQLAELLPKATVIFADGSDRSILDSEGIDQTDAVVTLTDIDEENLIVSMYANYLKVPKVITKINRTEYTEVFRDKGIDCVVSPKELCTNDIVRYVRAMGNRTGGAVVALHRIVDEKAEALEFRASESFRGLGQKLSDLELKPNILLSCINRRGKIIIPSGNDAIEKGDTVIVVTTADRFINDLNDILDEEKGLL